MDQLTQQLAALLATLGPWGVVGSVALIVFGPKLWALLKGKLPALPTLPKSPLPLPLPAGPADDGGLTKWEPLAKIAPGLAARLALLRRLLAERNPGSDPDRLLAAHLDTQTMTLVDVPPSPATPVK